MLKKFREIGKLSLITLNILFLSADLLIAEVPTTQLRLLNQTEVTKQLENLPGWTTEGKQLKGVFQFEDFVEAIAFVNRLVEPAETAGHHPDIMISYNQVTISLTTHDAGGLTKQDFELAKKISQLKESDPQS